MNICALSTGKGGAVALIRVSGPDAVKIVNSVFRSVREGKSLLDAKGQSLHLGRLIHDEELIDEVVVSVFRAPHSYTGEDVVEITCHASPYIISRILQVLIGEGCRQALPGEFTQRAFMNGKMDLSQAEAVADIISSKNATTHRIAMSQLRGNFSSELAMLREKLLHLTTLMELELDFSDHEDLEFADRTELIALSGTISDVVWRLAESFRTGKALKDGIPVTIVGKTNVGKSTLLNCLLHEDRAIVSDIHGTTRDTIEDTINIHGIDFRFIDTAGLRTTDDAVERIGIDRTIKKMQDAAIIIWLADNPDDYSESAMPTLVKNAFSRSQGKVLRVLNKIDLLKGKTDTCQASLLQISAKKSTGIELLEEELLKAADLPEIQENDIIITSARHYEALLKAHEALKRVTDGLQNDVPTDLLTEDLRECLTSLGEITGGTISNQEVLNNIWSNFCVGK